MPPIPALFLPTEDVAAAVVPGATFAASGSADDVYGWIGYESALPAPEGATYADDRGRRDECMRPRPGDPA